MTNIPKAEVAELERIVEAFKDNDGDAHDYFERAAIWLGTHGEELVRILKDQYLCGYHGGWNGICKNPAYTCEHSKLVCTCCGKPAAKACMFEGQFVCGAPLCHDCEHGSYNDQSLFGMGGGHVRKGIIK